MIDTLLVPDRRAQPAFGSARVDPGKPYHHRMIYAFPSRADLAPNLLESLS